MSDRDLYEVPEIERRPPTSHEFGCTHDPCRCEGPSMGDRTLMMRHRVPVGSEPPEGWTDASCDPFDDNMNVYLVPVEPDATWFTIEDPDDPRFQELWVLGIVKPVPLDGNDEKPDYEAAKIALHDILTKAGVSVIVNSDIVVDAAFGRGR